jgi:predicted nucleic acid-binding protein
MRLVVDTNIFVSAALKSESFPASVVRWVDRRGGLLKSEATERQLFDVLQRPYIAAHMRPSFLENVRRLLAAAELVAISERVARSIRLRVERTVLPDLRLAHEQPV